MELFINRLNNAIKANKEVKFYFRKEIFNILKLLKEKNYLSYRAYLCEDKHDSNKNY